MPSTRKLVFANSCYYHVFNRGLDRRDVFTSSREYLHAKKLVSYYSFHKPPVKYSKYVKLHDSRKVQIQESLTQKAVEVIAYCFMPNHFHFLLRQEVEGGVTEFASNFTNSYTKYFNLRHKRLGPLFQGLFKAVYVESDEQLVHLSRYIHLNPVTSHIIQFGDLSTYPWSSYIEYAGNSKQHIASSQIIRSFFKDQSDYVSFCKDQVGYARELKYVQHLTCE